MVAPVAAGVALEGGVFALSAMAKAIQALYGMTIEINAWIDKHIEEMKGSENPTIARTGRVIEMAKVGFLLGYTTSVVIIAAGQLLLGNGLFVAGKAAVTVATFNNPIAMTCAAFGAIYFGWGALTDVEREEILDKLSRGLEVGVELIKSIVAFVIEKTNELLSSKNLEEIKKFVAAAAESFGRSLSDVTKKISDVLSESFDSVKDVAGRGIDKTGELVSSAYGAAKDVAQRTAEGAAETIKKVKRDRIQVIDVEPEPPKSLPVGTNPKAVLLTQRKPRGTTRRK